MARQFKIPDPVYDMANCETCLKVSYDKSGLDALGEAYRNIRGQPAFLDALLHLDPQLPQVRLFKERPELIRWSQDGTIVLLPSVMNYDEEAARISPRRLKHRAEGFAINAWFVHPRQLEETVFSEKANRDDFRKAAANVSITPEIEPKTRVERNVARDKIGTIEEASHIPYLASIFDLKPQDLPWLRNLKCLTLKHLQEQYGVNEKDHVSLFFHGIIDTRTVTLHLHATVNQGLHPFEAQRAYALDDIIEALENGRSVKELALERGPLYTQVGEPQRAAFLREIPGMKVEEVENPYRIENRLDHEQLASPWVHGTGDSASITTEVTR